MKRSRSVTSCLAVAIIFTALLRGQANPLDGESLVKAAMNYYRGNASIALVHMTIHRPNWERTMTIKGWTRGQKDSIFTIISMTKIISVRLSNWQKGGLKGNLHLA